MKEKADWKWIEEYANEKDGKSKYFDKHLARAILELRDKL